MQKGISSVKHSLQNEHPGEVVLDVWGWQSMTHGCRSMGDISTFSLNHFKQITCGSGGMVMTNRDDLEERVRLFVDKCYFRDGRKRNPYFLAPNYQMTELQGAVAIAQFGKLESIIKRREELGTRLKNGLQQIEGIIPHYVPEGCNHTCFLYTVRIDKNRITVGPVEFGKALAAEGIPNEPNKVTGGMATYKYDIFKNRSAFPGTQFPFVSKDLDSNVEYKDGDCPEAEKAFEETFNFSINEFYADGDIDDMIEGVRKVADYYRK
ncbi:DegT/DnrJ/EryC1/StrS family aminotransferase [bacterium]|nr:DegT/DnrJ/EryC1/StrS family aminotransferase [bacterium]